MQDTSCLLAAGAPSAPLRLTRGLLSPTLRPTPPLVSDPGMLAQVGGLPEEAHGHLVRSGGPSVLAALVIIVIEMAVSRIGDVRYRLDAE